jgi:formate/nitrite transporter
MSLITQTLRRYCGAAMSRNYLTPAEVVDYAEQSSLASASMDARRFGLRAVLGGALLGVGGLLATVVAGGAVGLGETNPGLQKLLFGAVFPLGFIAVVLTGADLFTSNCATFIVSLYRGSITSWAALRTLTLSFTGNFVGSLLAAAVLGVATGIYVAGADATDYLHQVAGTKLDHTLLETFARGIGANFLVCIAAWQAYSAKDTISKMAGIWFPVMAFVALGMEHSIANMFFIPAALMTGLDATWMDFLVANLVPATLGNIVGGGLFVGMAYAWIYPRTPVDEPVETQRSR